MPANRRTSSNQILTQILTLKCGSYMFYPLAHSTHFFFNVHDVIDFMMFILGTKAKLYNPKGLKQEKMYDTV